MFVAIFVSNRLQCGDICGERSPSNSSANFRHLGLGEVSNEQGVAASKKGVQERGRLAARTHLTHAIHPTHPPLLVPPAMHKTKIARTNFHSRTKRLHGRQFASFFLVFFLILSSDRDQISPRFNCPETFYFLKRSKSANENQSRGTFIREIKTRVSGKRQTAEVTT